MFTDERHELADRNQKRDCVNESEKAQNDKARQPIGIPTGENLSDEIVGGSHKAAENVQRSTPNVQYRMKHVPGGRVELPTKGL